RQPTWQRSVRLISTHAPSSAYPSGIFAGLESGEDSSNRLHISAERSKPSELGEQKWRCVIERSQRIGGRPRHTQYVAAIVGHVHLTICGDSRESYAAECELVGCCVGVNVVGIFVALFLGIEVSDNNDVTQLSDNNDVIQPSDNTDTIRLSHTNDVIRLSDINDVIQLSENNTVTQPCDNNVI
ncbi:hypothetical protein BaRGS_00029042, partial [Batillaria attramentaria]